MNRSILLFLMLFLLLCTSILLGAGIGPAPISPVRLIAILLNTLHLWHGPIYWTRDQAVILLQVRLPRVVAALLVGSALAVSGVLLQGLLRNPLADPYLLGVSAGASLGVTIASLVTATAATIAGFSLISLGGFLGALLAVFTVYRIATIGGRTSTTTIILAGFAISSLLGSATTLLYTVSGQLATRLQSLFIWLLGGISVVGWSQIVLVFPLIIVGVTIALFFTSALNALALGEEGAAYLGIHVARVRVAIIILSTILTSLAVVLSGLVGFVGLITPHALRLLIGANHRRLLPAAALAGASFLILADLLARTVIAPGELPVGIITALLGGPFFLYLLQRQTRPSEWQ